MPQAFPQAFALIDGSKKPAVKWSDPATCRPSETFGATRYGLPTGPRNGVWVVDLDRGKAVGVDGLQSLAAYAPEELPETLTIRTPSGGLHLYFAWPSEGGIGNPVGILPGVDIRGAGGYVCAGGDYQVVSDTPPVLAPAWLVDLARSRADAAVAGESAVAIAPDHPEYPTRLQLAQVFILGEPPCISGRNGQAQLWKMALRIMRTYELPVDAAMEVLETYNRACQPPWSEAELRRTLVRAAEEGQGPTGMPSMTTGGLFGPAAPAPTGVPVPAHEGPWRRQRGQAHEYTFDVKAGVAGASVKLNSYGPKEIAAAFTGPGAFEPWCGVWQYDIFRRAVRAVNPPFKLDAENAGLSRRDLANIQVWMACVGAKTSLENINMAIEVAASQAEYHPVREYLEALEKVPVEAATAYFEGIAGRLWGAEERDALESSHLMRFAIAAVRRIKVPGTKVDTMLILAGEQGLRKSLFCSKLFGEFFLDQLPPINSGRGHEASIAIEGRWGIEVAELSAFHGVSEALKKDFLARCIDKYRPVFGIAVQERPRECVFIGTTNDDDFLTDPTGDTRYDICDVKGSIKIEELERDAFWAAAVALEAAGVEHWRDRAELARRREDGGFFSEHGESAGFVSDDSWTDDVLEGAKKCCDAEGWITADTVLKKCLAIDLAHRDAKSKNRVKAILRRAYGPAKVVHLEGRAQRAYAVVR